MLTAGGVTYYRFVDLARQSMVRHAIGGRAGGTSVGHLATLNISYTVGDERSRVAANREAFCSAAGVDPKGVCRAQQIHGNAVARVGGAEAGRGYAGLSAASAPEQATVPNVDSLVTNEPGVFLWLAFADCVPIMLFDPTHRAVGLAHAGWRGTVGHIVARTVEKMTDEFGTRPADLLAGIGPAIGPCCYEVGDDVAAAALAAFANDRDVVQPDVAGRMRLDLPGANARLLLNLGVPARQIEASEYCTSCRTDLFFSHRAEAGRTGRFAAMIGLEPEPTTGR